MNRFIAAAVAAIATAGAAQAGGLDRSGQSILALFDPEDTLAFSITHVNPDLKGEDVNGPGSYDAGDSYTNYQFSYANRLNDRFSYALIADQPFGADIFYDDDPATSALGGTLADIDSDAVSLLGRYEITNRFSVFGGLRAQKVSADIALNGRAYANAISAAGVARGINARNPAADVSAADVGAALQFASGVMTEETQAAFGAVSAAVGGPGNFAAAVAQPFQGSVGAFDAAGGYSLEAEDDWSLGLTLGAAYEIPEIALRFVATYHSEIGHDLRTSEVLGPLPASLGLPVDTVLEDRVRFATPQSVNLEFQTGVAEDTLLLAGLRWTDWDDFDVIPTNLGADLADIDDSYRWSLGVARRFTPNLIGLASLTYEHDNGNDSVSPLGPNDGQIGLSVGGRYSTENVAVSAGVNYTKVGSAYAGVGGNRAALFDDSSAVGLAFKVSYEF